MTSKIKLVLTDFDGILTDGGIYYSESGNLIKRFSVHDGMSLHLLQRAGVETGIVTSGVSPIVDMRAASIGVRHVFKDKERQGKLNSAKELCAELGLDLTKEVAYMGDDINCFDLLIEVGYAGCPSDAQPVIKEIPKIHITKLPGGRGALREWVNHLIANERFDKMDEVKKLFT